MRALDRNKWEIRIYDMIKKFHLLSKFSCVARNGGSYGSYSVVVQYKGTKNQRKGLED